jgi:hypothetical protein
MLIDNEFKIIFFTINFIQFIELRHHSKYNSLMVAIIFVLVVNFELVFTTLSRGTLFLSNFSLKLFLLVFSVSLCLSQFSFVINLLDLVVFSFIVIPLYFICSFRGCSLVVIGLCLSLCLFKLSLSPYLCVTHFLFHGLLILTFTIYGVFLISVLTAVGYTSHF